MEADTIREDQEPVTVAALVRDLRALGVTDGMTLLVHSSLSRLGWVAGGAQAVVVALLEAVGSGTLVMPTHSGLSDPSHWQRPPVPERWWPVIRAETPPYDPAVTPTRGMGAVVECFRAVPGVVRSDHPTLSFAARGPAAGEIVTDHRLDDGLGDGSPLGTLYRLDAWVLLLGVDHSNNTSLHLAEYRARFDKTTLTDGSPMLVDGQRRWVTYTDLDGSSDDFAALGDSFATDTGLERRGPTGYGEGRLMRQRDAVDYAVGWLERHRRGGAARP